MKTSEKNNRAKSLLKKKGWSYRTAAPELQVHFSHLNHVLNGRRNSQSLLDRIETLPTKKKMKEVAK